MLGNREGTIVREVAEKLSDSDTAWRCYCEYYSLDAVFYLDGDLVAQCPKGSTWLANTRIVFEHENDFTSGLFQEVSHLMIARADLRVLVTYPQEYDLKTELDRLADVIRRSGLADPNFLLITGKGVRGENGAWKEVEWKAYTYQADGLKLLNA